MKKKLLRFAICLMLAIAALSAGQLCFADEGYMDTERFDVNIVIEKNNVYRVTETIEVNFKTPRHGIYRTIPYRFDTAQWIDGELRVDHSFVRIDNIRANVSCDCSQEDDNEVIRLGDENKKISGRHTYSIEYIVRSREDGIKKFDEFYWNILPHDWETPIKSSRVSVSFPDDAEISDCELFSGVFGAQNTDKFEISRNGNTFTAVSKSPLLKNEGMTMRALLPDGYFTVSESNPTLEFIMVALMVFAFAAVIILKIVYGRNKEIIPTVSFYPPKGMTSADIGYVMDGITDSKDVVSLIIYWANKGLLSINEEEGGVMRLNRLKEIEQDARPYEKEMFSKLFEDRESVTTAELDEKFYIAVEEAKKGIRSFYSKDKNNCVFSKKSVVAGWVAKALCIIPITSLLVFGTIIKIVPEEIYAAAIGFALVFFGLLCWLNFAVYKKNVYSRAKYYLLSTLIWVLMLATIGVCVALGINDLRMTNPAIAAAVITAACAAMAAHMRSYTSNGVKIIGEIMGFKQFIRVSELDRLEMLVEKDPQYFYGVLPFAYVMGLSNKWAKKFENIATQPPSWYSSHDYGAAFNTWIFMNSFNSSINIIRENMVSPPVNSEGSAGSSSFGGFSGGGGGGGGGGSW